MGRLTERAGGLLGRLGGLGNGKWRRFVIIAGIAAIALLFLSTVIPPRVRGVAVVCGGAENVLIREKVVNTAARVLDIGVSQVYVTN